MLTFLKKMGLRGWKRWTVTLVILMGLSGVGSVELTSQSFFCNSCHIMNPYYDSWKKSTHKQVECVKCHIQPGAENFLAAKLNGAGQVVDDILHRTSMKPSASVSNLSCLRSGCHDVERVKASGKANGSYTFKHDKHIGLEYGGIKVVCATCHSHVSGEEHFQVNTNVCVTCHLIENGVNESAGPGKTPTILRLAVRGERATTARGTPVKDEAPAKDPVEAKDAPGKDATADAGKKAPPTSCLTCHNPPLQTIERNGLKVTHSEYLSYGAKCESCHRGTTAIPVPIEKGQCLECHTFGIERVQSTEQMHKTHLEGEHKIECFSCHGTIQHGPTAQVAAMEKFDCEKCHVDQHGIQRKTYLHKDQKLATEAGAAMSPMFLAHVDCTGCHVKPRAVSVKPYSGAMVNAATPESCDRCHKPGFGAELVPLWQKTTHSLYDQIETDLYTALDAGSTSQEVVAGLGEIRKILDTVRADGSWGVHNPRYTQELLEQARTKLAALSARIKESKP